jgi:hypothetical protein
MDAVLSSVWDKIREGRGKKQDTEMGWWDEIGWMRR